MYLVTIQQAAYCELMEHEQAALHGSSIRIKNENSFTKIEQNVEMTLIHFNGVCILLNNLFL